jgi:hypothetical protein
LTKQWLQNLDTENQGVIAMAPSLQLPEELYETTIEPAKRYSAGIERLGL